MTKKECEKNCSNCKNDCSSCRQYQEKAFELEVDEEMEQERLTQMWEKYRSWIIGGVSAILIATAGVQIYQSWWTNVRLNESDAFEQAMILSNNKKWAEAQKIFEELEQSGKTGYKTLAKMELADLLMEQGKKEEALKTWEKTIHSTKTTDPMHYVALISYAGYQVETGNPDEMLKMLKPALDNPQFQGLATEVAVLFLVRQNQKQKAKELIQIALLNPNISEEGRARLTNLTQTVEN